MAKKKAKKKAKSRKHRKAAPGDPNKTYKKQDLRFKPDGSFAKGGCPNPYGRPKGSLSFKNAYERSLRRLVKKGMTRTKLDEIVDSLVDQALRQAFKDRIAFAKEAADRVDGKPAQTLHVDERKVDPFEELSDAELRAIAECSDVADDTKEGEET